MSNYPHNRKSRPSPRANKPEDIFRNVLVRPNDCWEHWGKDKNQYGHVRVRIRMKRHGAHRVAYAVEHGIEDIGSLPLIMHTCNNPKCVNPDHLMAGDYSKNNQMAWDLGRQVVGPRKTYTQNDEAVTLRHSGKTYSQIAAVLGCSYSTAYYLVNPNKRLSRRQRRHLLLSGSDKSS